MRGRSRRKEPEPLEVRSWAGYPNYVCRRCDFATLDRELALQHVLERHAMKKENTND